MGMCVDRRESHLCKYFLFLTSFHLFDHDESSLYYYNKNASSFGKVLFETAYFVLCIIRSEIL